MLGKYFKVKSIVVTTMLLLVTVVYNPVSAQTKRSPVAANRERVETVVREAYEKFRSDTSGKNATVKTICLPRAADIPGRGRLSAVLSIMTVFPALFFCNRKHA